MTISTPKVSPAQCTLFVPSSLTTSKPVPYATLALANLLNRDKLIAVESHADDNLALRIDGSETSLTSESSILRFLCRESSSDIYPEHRDLDATAWVDSVMDACRGAYLKPETAEHAGKLVLTRPALFQGAENISLADIAVWGLFRSLLHHRLPVLECLKNEKDPLAQWYANLDKHNALQQAIRNVKQFLTLRQKEMARTSSVDTSKCVADLPMHEYNALDTFRRAIAREIVAHLPEPMEVDVLMTYLETTKGPSADLGEFCLPVPRLRLKGNPAQLCEQLASKIRPNAYIANATSSGTFLMFSLARPLLFESVLSLVNKLDNKYGNTQLLKGKKIIVEFSSPNIAKPFHAGHLRSTIIGNFIRNVADANGAQTTSINYLGDWGKQYGLLAVGYERFGNEEELQRDPIRHLYDIYVKINAMAKEEPSTDDEARAYFKRMEDGDELALKLWKRFRDLSIDKYRDIYGRLGVYFDVYSGESLYAEGMKRALKHLNDKKLLTESDGAVIVDLKPYKMVPAVVQKADGATLYITRDIAAAWERFEEYKFDEMYYVVGAQQDLHFKQLFKVLELAGFQWSSQCNHINFGMVKGMSTRKGTVVFLEDILNEAKQVMHSVMEKNADKYAQIENPWEVADAIGLAAVLIQDMSARRIKDYEFNWNRMTSFEGDTGPYLQYSHARLRSIERKFLEMLTPEEQKALSFDSGSWRKVSEMKVQEMVSLLAQFPDMVEVIPSRGYESSTLVNYLMHLCHKVSSCLDDVWVQGQTRDVAEGRYWVYRSARIVLGNGLRMLGVKPLERIIMTTLVLIFSLLFFVYSVPVHNDENPLYRLVEAVDLLDAIHAHPLTFPSWNSKNKRSRRTIEITPSTNENSQESKGSTVVDDFKWLFELRESVKRRRSNQIIAPVILNNVSDDDKNKHITTTTTIEPNTNITKQQLLPALTRPYQCKFPGCSASYFGSKGLENHKTIHRHFHPSERPFTCPFPNCSTAFSSQHGLNQHTRIVHARRFQ